MTIGEKIRYHRALKGWNQAYMAARLKMTAGAYAKIERGEVDPPFSRVESISKIFGLSVVELISTTSKGVMKSDFEKTIAEKDKEIMNLQNRVIQLLDKKK